MKVLQLFSVLFALAWFGVHAAVQPQQPNAQVAPVIIQEPKIPLVLDCEVLHGKQNAFAVSAINAEWGTVAERLSKSLASHRSLRALKNNLKLGLSSTVLTASLVVFARMYAMAHGDSMPGLDNFLLAGSGIFTGNAALNFIDAFAQWVQGQGPAYDVTCAPLTHKREAGNIHPHIRVKLNGDIKNSEDRAVLHDILQALPERTNNKIAQAQRWVAFKNGAVALGSGLLVAAGVGTLGYLGATHQLATLNPVSSACAAIAAGTVYCAAQFAQSINQWTHGPGVLHNPPVVAGGIDVRVETPV